MERLTVAEASKVLGITPDAVRKRIHRGDIRYTQNEDGKYFVYLDPSDTEHERYREQSRDELVFELRDRIRFLESELSNERSSHSESRRIIAGLVNRIPELPPPPDTSSPEPRESPQTASEEPSGTQGPQEEERRSWWRRLFG